MQTAGLGLAPTKREGFIYNSSTVATFNPLNEQFKVFYKKNESLYPDYELCKQVWDSALLARELYIKKL